MSVFTISVYKKCAAEYAGSFTNLIEYVGQILIISIIHSHITRLFTFVEKKYHIDDDYLRVIFFSGSYCVVLIEVIVIH